MEKPDLYAGANSNQYRDAADILQEFKDKMTWKENEQILDVGCGPGNTTTGLILPILPQSAHLLGSDISMKMIKFAQKNFESDRLKFTTLDIAADNITEVLGKEVFDKVFSFYCLHWIQDQRRAAQNIWDLLKPNGIALLAFLTDSPVYLLYELIRSNPKWREYMMDVDKYITPYRKMKNPIKTYTDLMESVGFEVIECKEKSVPVTTQNLEMHKNCLESINPFISRIPKNLQNEYMDCIMKILVDEGIIKLEKTKNEDRLTIPPNEMLIAFCRKIKKDT